MAKHKLIEEEEQIQKFWEAKKIFQKTLDKESTKGDYIFYDGPPFATGTPHYGHIVASLMKDVVPRFWTMNGYHVDRRWGWDCHGLPIENIVEKELAISSKKEIEENIGVEKFNASCRGKVLMYADEWKKFIPRIGRWVDMDKPYQTMDLSYMESIWWVFKQLWDKGLIYEGRKSMHICPRCETTLSQSEVSQGYKDITDLSCIAKFYLKEDPQVAVLAWTTTPWTLPGNVALAVSRDINYVKVKIEDSYYILAKSTLERVLESKKYEIIEEFKGRALLDKQYEPLFPYFNNPENQAKGFKIYDGDFVNTNEGTGIVHIACGFGADDLALAVKYDLPWIQHVDLSGRLIDEVVDFKNEQVKPTKNPQETDKKITAWLADHNKLFASATYNHSYPHCWRCDSPLLNYTTSSWFVKVSAIKDRMLDLAQSINWVPGHLKKGRFGNWLEGATDWSISRQRFWGSVMPIWKCEKCKKSEVFGSKDELEKRASISISDLHKEKMDKITFTCRSCKGEMRRLPDVLDCWFESGSMPYAQMHYPFANKEKFEKNFPAEFIAEGVDQTRCWFYYLLVLAVGVSDKIAFKNVIANGIVLAEDGQKMSKRLKNYPDPSAIINKYGADALRYYLLISPVMKADTLLFSEKGVDEVFKKLILILSNVVSFYKMYEQPLKEENDQPTHVLDKWILSKLNFLIKEVTANMKGYDLVLASRPFTAFIDELSTWYVRRSRSRMKGNDSSDKLQALAILKTVLSTISRLLAPFTPFIAETIYQAIEPKKESVHLEEWPVYDPHLIDFDLMESMGKVRIVVEKGLALRDEAKIKVRQPLASFTIDLEFSKELQELLKEEINVKNIIFGNKCKLDTKITESLKEEGQVRDLIRGINALRKKEGLTIKDQIVVHYQTDSQALVKVISKNIEELKENTLSQNWLQSEGREKIKINENILAITLKKI